MTQKDKNSLGVMLSLLFLLPGLYLWSKFTDNVIIFFIILIGSIILAMLIVEQIPDKKSKKKVTRIKQKTSTKKRNPTPTTSNNKTTTTRNPHNVKTIEQLLIYDLRDLSGFDFETLCLMYFKSLYKNVEELPLAKDRGVDFIFVDEDGFRTAVQVKHKMESGKYVTNNEINALTGAKRNHKCMRAMFISSTGYTRDARDTAAEHGMRIEAYHWVENKVLRWREKEAKKRKLA